MQDLISRQAAIDAIDSVFIDDESYKVWFKLAVKNLPSAQPERKEGKWIPVVNGRGGRECNQCHEYAPSYKTGEEHLSDFCPNCGARMEGEI